MKSINNTNISCLVKNLKDPLFHNYIKDFIAGPRNLFFLYRRYKIEFPSDISTHNYNGDKIPTPFVPTPIVCACQHGRMNDVEDFVNLFPFHKYLTNRDVNGYRDDMTLKDMVNQFGTTSCGLPLTPIIAAAEFAPDFQIVKYLIETR